MISMKITRVNKARVLKRLARNIFRGCQFTVEKIQSVIKFWQGLEEHSKDIVFTFAGVGAILFFIWVVLPTAGKWVES